MWFEGFEAEATVPAEDLDKAPLPFRFWADW